MYDINIYMYIYPQFADANLKLIHVCKIIAIVACFEGDIYCSITHPSTSIRSPVDVRCGIILLRLSPESTGGMA